MDKFLKQKIWDNLWGPSGTILIHLMVVVVLLKFAVFDRPQPQTEVEVVVMTVEPPEELEEINEELKELEDIPTVVDTVAPPTVSVDQEPPKVDAVGPSAAEAVDLSTFDVMESVSPLRFKGLYAGRSSGGRSSALKEFSGGYGERTEFAVLQALKWLRDHQYPDGSWGPEYRVAFTGLALLTFLAHGETTASPDYGASIRKGLKYLLKQQKDGTFVAGGHGVPQQVRAYEHAIGTYAVSEAYGLTGIPFLKFAMEDAVQVILDGQHAAGSWDYGYNIEVNAHTDVSLSGWHIQALKAAAMSGAENRGLKVAIESSMDGLKAMYDSRTGIFAYSTRSKDHGPDLIMTGVAVLCMQLTGHALDAEARSGTKALQDLDFRWIRTETGGADDRKVASWPYYAWYYITQARFHQGGKTWVEWNRQFAPVLADMQNPNGSWGPAPDSEEARFGPVYTTTLAALMLQVYYRFLPTYKPIEVEQGPAEKAGEDEDIIIDFSSRPTGEAHG